MMQIASYSIDLQQDDHMAVTTKLVRRVTVSLKPDDHRALFALARKNGIPVATVMQIAVKQFLNRQKSDDITLV